MGFTQWTGVLFMSVPMHTILTEPDPDGGWAMAGWIMSPGVCYFMSLGSVQCEVLNGYAQD